MFRAIILEILESVIIISCKFFNNIYIYINPRFQDEKITICSAIEKILAALKLELFQQRRRNV